MARGGWGGGGGIYNECTVGLRFASLICAVTSYRQEIRTFTFLYLNILLTSGVHLRF